MSIKDLYSADLLARNAGYSFEETTVDDMTKVEFKTGGDATVDEATSLVADDAYRTIRERQVGFASDVALIGPGVWVTRDQVTVQTTDDTPTVVDSVTLVDESVCVVRANFIAIEDDGTDRGAYVYTATVYRHGGGATIQGSISTDHEGFSDSNWIAEIVVSGNDVQARVTGVISETIEWHCTIQYMGT